MRLDSTCSLDHTSTNISISPYLIHKVDLVVIQLRSSGYSTLLYMTNVTITHHPCQVRKSSAPSKKDHLVQQRMAPIFPPKSNTSSVSHQPLSSCLGRSTNGTVDDVPSSDSDSYEDVMSGDDDDEVIKSQWTVGKNTLPRVAPNNSSTAEVCVWRSHCIMR